MCCVAFRTAFKIEITSLHSGWLCRAIQWNWSSLSGHVVSYTHDSIKFITVSRLEMHARVCRRLCPAYLSTSSTNVIMFAGNSNSVRNWMLLLVDWLVGASILLLLPLLMVLPLYCDFLFLVYWAQPSDCRRVPPRWVCVFVGGML